jgi:hypothetical protein
VPYGAAAALATGLPHLTQNGSLITGKSLKQLSQTAGSSEAFMGDLQIRQCAGKSRLINPFQKAFAMDSRSALSIQLQEKRGSIASLSPLITNAPKG